MGLPWRQRAAERAVAGLETDEGEALAEAATRLQQQEERQGAAGGGIEVRAEGVGEASLWSAKQTTITCK